MTNYHLILWSITIRKVSLALEFKPADLWVGAFSGRTYRAPSVDAQGHTRRRWQTDVWICVVPMLPIHLAWLRTERKKKRYSSSLEWTREVH